MIMIKKMLLSAAFLASVSTSAAAAVREGETVQLLSNLHPDTNRRLVYSLNYQLPSIIPICTEVKILSMKRKKMTFSWNGVEYTFKYDGHTKKAGIGFDKAVATYFGPQCDQSKMNRMSQADKDGIRVGRAKVGMSREGILMAMGRPPYHANPDLSSPAWTYWMNKFNRKVIEFDKKGMVTAVRD